MIQGIHESARKLGSFQEPILRVQATKRMKRAKRPARYYNKNYNKQTKNLEDSTKETGESVFGNDFYNIFRLHLIALLCCNPNKLHLGRW